MDDSPLPSEMQLDLDRLISELAPAANVVVATDFGHGLIGTSELRRMKDDAILVNLARG